MRVVYSKKFRKKFSKLNRKLQQKVFSAISNIPTGDIKKLTGKRTSVIYRLRVSKYRILFNLDDELVKILIIDSRGDVYKNIGD
mgnify:FL=1